LLKTSPWIVVCSAPLTLVRCVGAVLRMLCMTSGSA
jgi:hypothetical protein